MLANKCKMVHNSHINANDQKINAKNGSSLCFASTRACHDRHSCVSESCDSSTRANSHLTISPGSRAMGHASILPLLPLPFLSCSPPPFPSSRATRTITQSSRPAGEDQRGSDRKSIRNLVPSFLQHISLIRTRSFLLPCHVAFCFCNLNWKA